MRMVLAAALVLGLTACQEADGEDMTATPGVPGVTAGAVTASDSWCVDSAELATEPRETEGIRRRYRHWLLCDYDRPKALRYLDLLVARNDPSAVHEKSVLLRSSNLAESDRLRRQAEALGYRSPPTTVEEQLRELAALK